MGYVVQIVSRRGRGSLGYVRRGRLVQRPENATCYAHPSAARKAATRFLEFDRGFELLRAEILNYRGEL